MNSRLVPTLDPPRIRPRGLGPEHAPEAGLGTAPKWESYYLSALLLSCFLDLWTPAIPLAGLHLRFSEIVVLPGIFLLAHRHARFGWRGWCPPLALWSVLVCAFYLGWTLINSLEPLRGLAHSLLLSINMLHYWMVSILASTNWVEYRRAIRWVSGSIVVMGAWMLLSYVMGRAGLLQVGALDRLALGASMSAGAEVFRLDYGVLGGCIGAWAAVLSLGSLLSQRRRRWMPAAGLLMGSMAMVLGLSRGAIVCMLMGLASYCLALVWGGQARRVVGAITLAGALLGTGVGTALVYFPNNAVVQSFTGRVALLLSSDSYSTGTVAARLDSWRLMLHDVREHPFWGNGGDSYHIYFPPEIQDSENFPLEILHATGVWGLGALAVLIFGVMWRSLRQLRARTLAPAQRALLAGVLAAFVGLFVASQTNPVGWSALFWLALGLVAAGNRLAAGRMLQTVGRRRADSRLIPGQHQEAW